jgi:hypothetical protein
MILSSLVLRKATVDRLSSNQLRDEVVRNLTAIATDMAQCLGDRAPAIETIEGVRLAFDTFEADIVAAQASLGDEVLAASKEYYQRCATRWEAVKTHDSPDWIIARRLPVTAAIKELMIARIHARVSWQYPGLQIRPYGSGLTEFMVAADPLYLVDQNAWVLRDVVAQFHPDYQKRLRTYSYDVANDKYLSELPDEQFGFALVYNYLEFTSFDVVKQILDELWAKLRAGGTVAITINNCDRAEAIQHVESGYAAFTPGNLVVSYAELIGFKLSYQLDITGSSTWYEFQKPGTLVSLRGGQSLAKILARRARLV